MVEMVNYQWDEENNVSKQHRVCELLNQRTGNISRVNEEYYKHYELVTWELIKEEEE
jgi:hypothetical protein